MASYDDERLTTQVYQDAIDAVRATRARRPKLDRFKNANVDRRDLPWHPPDGTLMHPIADQERSIVGHFVRGAFRAQTETEMAIAAIAEERYFGRHRKYPGALGELVPSYLRRVPIDYMDGKDLRYKPRGDESYLLYSVGENGIDDGGDATPGTDIGWRFMRGRDWVWPVAATEQEVKSYEIEQEQKLENKRPEPKK